MIGKSGIDIIEFCEDLANKRKEEIRNTSDDIEIKGISYYVSSDGNDENDGRSPETAWKSLSRVSKAELSVGDGVRFRRGDVFRGNVAARSGVTYTAYGIGEKPRIYCGDRNMADEGLWELVDELHHIWKYARKITDCGTLVFDDGARHSRKLIPSYKNGRFVCRYDENKAFDIKEEMTENLDIFCSYADNFTVVPSKGECFPVPAMCNSCFGDLYLRCDEGNPGKVFETIEAIPWLCAFSVGENYNVWIDNITIKYAKFGVSAEGKEVKGLKITNCEIGWIGGNIQNYLGCDPNYPQGRRGSVTRYGNAIEIYGGCDGYEVSGCYIYQCYDAGITHQITTNGDKYLLKNILYKDNIVEDCVYSIEYFLEKNKADDDSRIENCEICNNLLRRSGYGWGQQRHNVDTPAHIKGWSYDNTAQSFSIHHNIFDRAAYRMIHTVSKYKDSCPVMYANTYVQKKGLMLGQYGENCESEPPMLVFDENVSNTIKEQLCEEDAEVFII